MKNVLAFGNPLLDITISSKEVPELIKKYNLNPNGQKEISKQEMDLLMNDIKGLDKHFSPGGCSQNSLRVLQWILKKKGKVSIFGSVGKDQEADTLRDILKSEGVQTRYMEQDLPTGKTVALVSGFSRSLVAHIGAAEIFPLKRLLSYEDFPQLFDSSDIIFIEAYFLKNRFEAAKYLVDHCQSSGKPLAFNLCGDYLFPLIPEEIRYLARCSNIIFANITEYRALKNLLNSSSTQEMALDLIQSFDAKKYVKTLLITDGANPIKCYFGKEEIIMNPPALSASDIKDTTAAGDAFIGGFLAGFSQSRDIKECIKMGFYGASNIIKQSGCTLPKYDSQIDN